MYQRFNFLSTYCLKSFTLYIWIFNVFSEYMYIDFSHSHDVQKLFCIQQYNLKCPISYVARKISFIIWTNFMERLTNDVIVSNCCFLLWNILVINNLKWHQLQNMYTCLWGPLWHANSFYEVCTLDETQILLYCIKIYPIHRTNCWE